jgi:hypothetical protein
MAMRGLNLSVPNVAVMQGWAYVGHMGCASLFTSHIHPSGDTLPVNLSPLHFAQDIKVQINSFCAKK